MGGSSRHHLAVPDCGQQVFGPQPVHQHPISARARGSCTSKEKLWAGRYNNPQCTQHGPACCTSVQREGRESVTVSWMVLMVVCWGSWDSALPPLHQVRIRLGILVSQLRVPSPAFRVNI